MDYDAIVVGSGFGGSVAALRLSQKGYRVAIVEQGRRVGPEEIEAAAAGPRRLIWAPSLGLGGFFYQRIFRHVTIVGGVGVGGGSIVYAAVLLEPRASFYADPHWSALGVDWQRELAPHYATASRMLGVVENPWMAEMDDYLEETARAIGGHDTFGPTPLGVYFGRREVTVPDPFFDGRGPERTGCRLCGECLAGCQHGAKNSLERNYLYLAEGEGAEILPERRVVSIEPVAGGYRARMVHPLRPWHRYEPLRAPRVFLAAGVLGTLELLFRCRDDLGTLPNLSDQLGRVVRTNSEAIVGALSSDPDIDLTEGPAISSHFYPNEATHMTQNRFPRAYEFMKWQAGPLQDGHDASRRRRATLRRLLGDPIRAASNWRAKDWHRRVSVISVMQDLDNQLSLRWQRSPLPPFRRRLVSVPVPGKPSPSYIPEANEAARAFARAAGGEPFNSLLETVAGQSVTAHILGGCQMGASPDTGVIDPRHEVFGHPGLFVVDGAAISANVGVNPSLTITALAERALSLVE